ncbi:MAG: 3-phosphoshikimate 1-carboxyvinyltransferase [Planctomycetes bacterium]|nr:3-phosphoshikimate 1-carboxyvinyltransferase [Planctomycetota bacterium]
MPVFPRSIPVRPIAAFRATVRPPGSKSLTNRALLLAALAEGESVLRGPLLADDSSQMFNALTALGFAPLMDNEAQLIHVTGRAGLIPARVNQTDLHLGNAGTAYRFLAAACALGDRRYRLDGIERMRQRPIGQLVDALRRIGGKVDYLGTQGFPPLLVHGTGLEGGELVMPPTLSSQYISALLQIAPYCRKGLTIKFEGPVTSRPYVEMTLALMRTFGVESETDEQFTRVNVAPGRYRGTDYAIEPDASNATYFLAAAAVVPGSTCTIEGLGMSSLQGDKGFADVLHLMGAGLVYGRDFITVMGPKEGAFLRGIEVDLNHMPDTAQTLAVVALFAKGPTTIRNVGNLRVKETDRLAALQTELTKLGAAVEIEGDDITIEPPPDNKLTPAAIDTYNDHRMAMSFAVAGLRSEGVTINDPACVEKTFPEFFEYLGRLSPPR